MNVTETVPGPVQVLRRRHDLRIPVERGDNSP